MTDQQATASASSSSGPAKEEPKRYLHRGQLEKYIETDYKQFCKELCHFCKEKKATKRFAKTMSFITITMADAFWCPDCGRILCEQCRYGPHGCERIEGEKERNKNKTAEEIREEMESRALKERAKEEALEDDKRMERERLAEETSKRKFRRKVYAEKSKMIEQTMQQWLRTVISSSAASATAFSQGGTRKEVEDMFEKIKRLALQLYNDWEHPAQNCLLKDEWREVQQIYRRFVEISGVQVRDPESGGPLQMVHPWEEDGGGPPTT
ncbi:unnamed protein product [Amoebophrya sp. A25]|nr:unnamed protein product [Amoebophrya sp. A25]|eukprot:GSA25T00023082001.1